MDRRKAREAQYKNAPAIFLGSMMIVCGPYMAPPEKVPLKDTIMSYLKKGDNGASEEAPSENEA